MPADTSSSRALACHHCGSTDLGLTEITEEIHIWDKGLVVVDGEIRPTGEARHVPGDIQTSRSWIKCDECQRGWHPRRPVGDALYEGVPNAG